MTETPETPATIQEPLTRDDVLCCIEKRGTAQGLDLSGQQIQVGIDLSRSVLAGIVLREVRLSTTNLSDTCLCKADLRGAVIQDSNLERASLMKADLRWARMYNVQMVGAKLSGAFLSNVDFRQTSLEFADWQQGKIVGEESARHFGLAEAAYRALRVHYNQLGVGNIAGEFFYRERSAQRNAWWSGASDSQGFWKALRSRQWRAVLRALWPQRPLPWLGSWLLNCLFGYGERPGRVVGWWVATIVLSSLAYFAWGGLSFWDALYYSLVSFPALGYGGWVNIDWTVVKDWVRWAGPIEALGGVILIALFLTTFVRKMTR